MGARPKTARPRAAAKKTPDKKLKIFTIEQLEALYRKIFRECILVGEAIERERNKKSRREETHAPSCSPTGMLGSSLGLAIDVDGGDTTDEE